MDERHAQRESFMPSWFVKIIVQNDERINELVRGANFETPEQAQKEIFQHIELYLQYETVAFRSRLSFASGI